MIINPAASSTLSARSTGKTGNPSNGRLARASAPLIAMIPVLELYATPVPGLSVGRLLMLLFTIIGLLVLIVTRKPAIMAPLVFALALIGISCLALLLFPMVDGELYKVVARMFIVGSWGIAISVAVPALMDRISVARWVIRIAKLATGYLLVQYVAWALIQRSLPSVLNRPPVLTPMSSGYADTDALVQHYRDFFFRPASFFAEPQYYSDFATLALVLCLFRSPERPLYRSAAIVSLGLVASTSTTALIMVGLVWGAFLVRQARRRILHPLTIWVAAAVLLASAIYVAPKSQALLESVAKLGSVDANVRVGGSFAQLGALTGPRLLTGTGLGLEGQLLPNPGQYMNSLTIVFLSTGVLGCLALIAYAMGLWALATGAQRLIVCFYFLLSASGSILYSDRSFLWLGLALAPAAVGARDRAVDTVDPSKTRGVPFHMLRRINGRQPA